MIENITKEKAKQLLDEYCEKGQEFNIFRVLKLENYEIRHSNLLAWLLSPNQTHGFKDSFLKKIIEKAASKKNISITYKDNDDIKVYRELDNIDILVINNTQNYLILIENKINSNQHDNQLERYAQIVENDFEKYQKIYIYLKPENNEILPEYYIDMSYKEVINIIKDVLQLVQDLGVKILLEHYIKIFDSRYNRVGNVSLMDICLRLQQENVKLNDEEQNIVWRMAEQRRYEIMTSLAVILSENNKVSEVQQKIYKVVFKLKSENETFYEFDNTNTRDNSQIKFTKYVNNYPQNTDLFLDNDEYDEIFYTYGENACNEIKRKLSEELRNNNVKSFPFRH